MATHYLHTLAELGWLDVDRKALPSLDSRLNVRSKHVPDPGLLDRLQRKFINAVLPGPIDFRELEANGVLVNRLWDTYIIFD